MYAAYEEAWIIGQADEPVAWDNPAEEDQQKQVGWRLLETFFRETSLRSTDKPEAVEVAVEADLSAHGLPRLVGVLDLVQDGRIIDFKTVGQTPTPEKSALLHATQVSRVLAVVPGEHRPERKPPSSCITWSSSSSPGSSSSPCRPAATGPVNRLYRVIESYVRGLERQDFVPSPGLQCATCEFAPSAPPGRDNKNFFFFFFFFKKKISPRCQPKPKSTSVRSGGAFLFVR